MRPYKGFLLGAGMLAGIYGCATMHDKAPMPGDIEMKPSGVTRRFVEDHMGTGLSFLETTYHFKELGGEIIFCYPKSEKEKHLLYLVKEGGRVVKAEIKNRSSCKRCHRKWPPEHPEYKRLPVGRDDPLETG